MNSGGGKKRGWVFAVIGILVVAVVVVVAIVFAGRGQGGESDKALTTEEYFYRYANYFSNGSNKIDGFSDNYVGFGSSYLGERMISREIEQSQIDMVSQYYNVFYDNYIQEVSDDEYIVSLLDANMRELKLLLGYYGNDALTRNSIFSTYKEDGYEAALKLVSETASRFDEVGELYDLSYSEILKKWGDDTVALAVKYTEMGCFDDEEVDYECAAEKVTEEIALLSEEITLQYSDLKLLLELSENDVYSNIFEIKNIIQNDNNAEEGGDEQEN